MKLVCVILLLSVAVVTSFQNMRPKLGLRASRVFQKDPKKITPIAPKVKPIAPKQVAKTSDADADPWAAADAQDSSVAEAQVAVEGEGSIDSKGSEVVIQETEEEKYKREKLAEIADLKAKEVFVTRSTGRYECQACGYVYAEAQGYEKRGIAPGTAFTDASMEKFRCPACGANKKYFIEETETLSGFKENLKYGFGTNAMTGDQKGGLIYGGLFIGFLIFMSGYLLE
jgi:rubredoxin